MLEADDQEPPDWADDVLHGRPPPSQRDIRHDRRRKERENDLLNDVRFISCDITGVEAFSTSGNLVTIHPEDNMAERVTVLEQLLGEEDLAQEIDSDCIPRTLFAQIMALKERPDIKSGQYLANYYAVHGDPYDLDDSE